MTKVKPLSANEILHSTVDQARLNRPLNQDNKLLAVFTAHKSSPTDEVDDLASQLGPERCQQEKSQIYLIVRSLKNCQGQQKGYALNVGDVIKMGRMEYAVLQIQNNKERLYSSSETVEKMFSKQFNRIYTVEHTHSTGPCRICLLEQETEDNFFTAPCLCKGSCQMIHLNCLKTWLDSKVKKKTVNYATLINFKKFECEICMHALPKTIIKNGVSYQLFQLQRPVNTPYIMLESQINQKGQKYIYILQATKQVIKVGRGQDCDVRVTDISVSRMHAFIKYDLGNFLIIDNNSKFGTLIKVRQNITVSWDKVAVQVGRTVITFVMRSRQAPNKQKAKTISGFPSLSNFKYNLK